MSGAYDLMVLVRGPHHQAAGALRIQKLSTLEHVNSTATHFVLKRYKNEGVILEGVRRDERLAVTPELRNPSSAAGWPTCRPPASASSSTSSAK
jgi:hypothetical protein